MTKDKIKYGIIGGLFLYVVYIYIFKIGIIQSFTGDTGVAPLLPVTLFILGVGFVVGSFFGNK